MREAISAGATVAILLAMVPGCLCCCVFRYRESGNPSAPMWLLHGAEVSVWLVPLALAIALVVFGLQVVRWFEDRRAATPLPPPAPDPLATYRDGPAAECPRHPFSR